MEQLNFVNLIQAGAAAVGILGGLLLWSTKGKEYRGVSLLLLLTAIASVINILEESGITRDIYLISPVFIMLFGPATYLAIKFLIDKRLASIQLLHLVPVFLFVGLTPYLQLVIALGTMWRLAYALLTVQLLLQYRRWLDEQRSDSDELSLNWLVWILLLTAGFNLVDLVRLNIQHWLPYQLNVLGQAVNNAVWLIAAMVIIIKLQQQAKVPSHHSLNLATNSEQGGAAEYGTIFTELDQLMQTHRWYLQPRLSLSDVSRQTGLQSRDISRAINLHAEKSFNEYINNYRVDYVCNELTSNQPKSLLEISADAGFSSKASFNKVFKQFTKLTPSQYKARQHV
ncbi:helix-turn-helix domain-containing protein [Neiella marina]|uniref:Helix-turn-helix domain-containing protein n=1 Tax=Neiella holothuriorum TaxID=2870530 RepID=A0ABS7EHD9_9GAMM|nr:helix-turn-helix domain-containing protein [Neiella holothuriorum]MBW8191758.1 helix-turn-helix domain-containing protein [Neiella holothuriorum]